MEIKLRPFVKRVRLYVTWTKTVESLRDFRRAITQGFEGNSARACDFIPNAPCDISIYQYWGKKGHGAIDVAIPYREPILASHDGVVLEVENDRSAGLGITLWSPTGRFKTLYWHNDRNIVEVGQNVTEGQIIAYGDNTGYSTGHHVHFALKLTDDKGNTLNKDNGYLGGIDPVNYFYMPNDNMFELIRVDGDKDVYLLRDNKKTLIYNSMALQLISSFENVRTITQEEFNAIPDSGFELASLEKE